MAEKWRAREEDVDAIAAARQQDPFAVLGPHLTPDGWVVRARHSGGVSLGGAAAAFVRPEVASLERSAERLPSDHLQYAGTVQSLLFDGANSAVLLNEERSGFEFRVALPQTGRFADLKVGERVSFGFDPQRAICFNA